MASSDIFISDQVKNTVRVATLKTLCDNDFSLPIPCGNEKVLLNGENRLRLPNMGLFQNNYSLNYIYENSTHYLGCSKISTSHTC